VRVAVLETIEVPTKVSGTPDRPPVSAFAILIDDGKKCTMISKAPRTSSDTNDTYPLDEGKEGTMISEASGASSDTKGTYHHTWVARRAASRFFKEMDEVRLPEMLLQCGRPDSIFAPDSALLYYAKRREDGTIERTWQASTSMGDIGHWTRSSPQRQEAVARLLKDARPPGRGDREGVDLGISANQYYVWHAMMLEYGRLGAMFCTLRPNEGPSSPDDVGDLIKKVRNSN